MFTKHVLAPAQLKTAGAEEGSVEAVFSTFNTIDLDGDVTLPSAFTPGQEVLMVWAHRWDEPIGKGVILADARRATFAGKFWLDTQAGLEAYRRVKNAGKLQEYSYGFRVLDSAGGEYRGQPVRFLKEVEVFEVSPVLKGAAGRGNSYTLSVKHDERDGRGGHVSQAEALKVVAETEVAIARSYGVDIPETLRERTERELRRARALGVPV